MGYWTKFMRLFSLFILFPLAKADKDNFWQKKKCVVLLLSSKVFALLTMSPQVSILNYCYSYLYKIGNEPSLSFLLRGVGFDRKKVLGVVPFWRQRAASLDYALLDNWAKRVIYVESLNLIPPNNCTHADIITRRWLWWQRRKCKAWRFCNVSPRVHTQYNYSLSLLALFQTHANTLITSLTSPSGFQPFVTASDAPGPMKNINI
jgi:hypothetical protein